jgi:hypothetical protein
MDIHGEPRGDQVEQRGDKRLPEPDELASSPPITGPTPGPIRWAVCTAPIADGIFSRGRLAAMATDNEP